MHENKRPEVEPVEPSWDDFTQADELMKELAALTALYQRREFAPLVWEGDNA